MKQCYYFQVLDGETEAQTDFSLDAEGDLGVMMLTAVEDWNPPPKVLHTVPGEELPLNEIHSQPLRPCSELR